MTINVLSAAKHMVERSRRSLSNLELQKLIYLAHMFHLGRRREALVTGHFQAWDYGPVHPELYREARIYGSEPVQAIMAPNVYIKQLAGSSEEAVLDEAYDALGRAGPGQLIHATHRKGGAWDKNYIPGRRGLIIPNRDILEEYLTLG